MAERNMVPAMQDASLLRRIGRKMREPTDDLGWPMIERFDAAKELDAIADRLISAPTPEPDQ